MSSKDDNMIKKLQKEMHAKTEEEVRKRNEKAKAQKSKKTRK